MNSAPVPSTAPALVAQQAQRPLFGLALLAAAAGIWVLEAQCRRALAHVPADGRGDALLSTTGLKGSLRLLRGVLPEACGLALCVVLALVLLSRSDAAHVPEEDTEIWLQIRAEWPLLVTADTLLGFQAMLKVLVLSSAACRAEEMLSSPMAGLPTVFLLCAAAARCALLALSPRDVYHLDGPLGGSLNAAAEASTLLLSIYLAFRQAHQAWPRFPQAPALLAVTSLVMVGWTARANRLGLADPGDSHLDTLFSAAQYADLVASLAFLAGTGRAVANRRVPSPFAFFAHALLPLQQLLSAYFLLTAWGGEPLEEIPALVGAGRPFEMLQLAGIAQVGAYAAAGVVQLAFTNEEDKDAVVAVEV